MKEAFQKMAKEFGDDKVRAFQQNAKDLVNGDVIRTEAPMDIKKKKRISLFNWRG
jgi:protein-tyrosine phosphatase